MSPRRPPSIYRNALQVSPELIARLDESQLTELLSELLRAQASRCHASASEIRVNADGNAPDDGCDGWSPKPKNDDPWLGDAETCWQFKAGKAGLPGRLTKEPLKLLPRKTLEGGGRFVVVANGSTNGVKGEKSRLKALTLAAEKSNIPTERIDVIGCDRLTSWCNENPAVAARWAGRPPSVRTLADWQASETHQVPWHASEQIESEIAAQRLGLAFETGTVQHLHIHGHPGVGKTRFALELCRNAEWGTAVIYFPQASEPGLLELIHSVADDPGVRLVLVADEVQANQLLPLREAVSRTNARLRLITIGHSRTPEPARIPELLVKPLSREMVVKVVKGWFPAMPWEHIDFVARFADGYVRLASLAAHAVDRCAFRST